MKAAPSAICKLGEPLNCIGENVDQSNLKTAIVNRDLRRYFGLHVGNWDQLDVEYPDRATNRVCVNIGECHAMSYNSTTSAAICVTIV